MFSMPLQFYTCSVCSVYPKQRSKQHIGSPANFLCERIDSCMSATLGSQRVGICTRSAYEGADGCFESGRVGRVSLSRRGRNLVQDYLKHVFVTHVSDLCLLIFAWGRIRMFLLLGLGPTIYVYIYI